MDTHSVDHDTEIDQLQWGTFGDWIQLVRLPTSFTLLSNCLAAGIVAGHLWWPMTAFIPTLLASLFAYWAGMIHNDVVDQEEDRRQGHHHEHHDRGNTGLLASRPGNLADLLADLSHEHCGIRLRHFAYVRVPDCCKASS